MGFPNLCFERDTTRLGRHRRPYQTSATQGLCKPSAILNEVNRPIRLRSFTVALQPGGLFDLRGKDMQMFASDAVLCQTLSQLESLCIESAKCVWDAPASSVKGEIAVEAITALCRSPLLQDLTLDFDAEERTTHSRRRYDVEQVPFQVLRSRVKPWPLLKKFCLRGWCELPGPDIARFIDLHAATLEHVETIRSGDLAYRLSADQE